MMNGDFVSGTEVGGFSRLSHQELTKTNYPHLYLSGNKTRDLELVMS
jgi:hypothetical protein